MLERAGARLWVSIIVIVCAFPAVVFVISAVWFTRLYFAPPLIVEATPRGPSALVQVEAAVPPPAAEPVTPPLVAQTPEPLSTMSVLGDAHPASSDPAQDISTVESHVMPAKPAALEPSEPTAGPVPPVLAQAEAPAPQLKQQPTEMAEAVAPPPDPNASELASAPHAVAPPVLGDAHPASSNPAQDISTLETPVMPAKPASLEPSEPIAGPVPPVLAQAEASAPQLKQPPTEMAEDVAPPPDAKASELASAPLAMAPPVLGDAHPASSDPAQDISTVETPVMPAKPAALEPAEPIEGPIPLPRPKPRVTVAHVSRTVSLARSPPLANSPRPTSRY